MFFAKDLKKTLLPVTHVLSNKYKWRFLLLHLNPDHPNSAKWRRKTEYIYIYIHMFIYLFLLAEVAVINEVKFPVYS